MNHLCLCVLYIRYCCSRNWFNQYLARFHSFYCSIYFYWKIKWARSHVERISLRAYYQRQSGVCDCIVQLEVDAARLEIVSQFWFSSKLFLFPMSWLEYSLISYYSMDGLRLKRFLAIPFALSTHCTKIRYQSVSTSLDMKFNMRDIVVDWNGTKSKEFAEESKNDMI